MLIRENSGLMMMDGSTTGTTTSKTTFSSSTSSSTCSLPSSCASNGNAPSSSTNTSTATTATPFDVIVVTCPDERAAQAALEGPLAQLQEQYPTMYMTATCDPLGVRCGSGGGTLAAMDLIPQIETCRSLVFHAGGDSSRAPTQMVLGKAWTTLPSNDWNHNNNNNNNNNHKNNNNMKQEEEKEEHSKEASGNNDSSQSTMNPTVWMLQQLMKRFPNLPPGSVIVVAADTILSLLSQPNKNSNNNTNNNVVMDQIANAMMVVPTNVAVLGVAVPAPFSTAKNHGVFGLDRMEVMETGSSSSSSAAGIYAVEEVWQKPSLSVLPTLVTSHVKKTTTTTAMGEEEEEPEAWIDTGIVIFFPLAVKALQHLMNTVLYPCTKRGLEDLYRRAINNNNNKPHNNGHAKMDDTIAAAAVKDDDTTALCAFAKRHALSVDLYTHLLQAFRDTSPSSTSSSLETYLKSFSKTSVPSHILTEMYQTLSVLPLHVMALPQGRFLHLGTTREYMDFLVINTTATANTTTSSSSSATTTTPTTTVVDEHEEPWGFKLGLTRRQGSLVQIPPLSIPTTTSTATPTIISVAPTAVMVQSLIHVGHGGDGGGYNTSHKSSDEDDDDNDERITTMNGHYHPNHDDKTTTTTQMADDTEHDRKYAATHVVGHGTIIEHCNLTLLDDSVVPSSHSTRTTTTTTTSSCFQVGNNCLLSGLRGTWRSSDPPLIVPDDIVVQMVPLMPESSSTTASSNSTTGSRRWVYMVLGVDDDIKKTPCPALYGKCTKEVLQQLNLTPGDVWSPDDADTTVVDGGGIGCLWKARIHPVIVQEGPEVELLYSWYFLWLEWLLMPFSSTTTETTTPAPSTKVLESLQRWKQAPRLSLSEIRNQSDALLEFKYRQDLNQRIIPNAIHQYWRTIVNTLEQRQHIPCCFHWVLDEFAANRYLQTLASSSSSPSTHAAALAVMQLDQVVRKGLASADDAAQWDVCGRTLMVTSALLDDLATIAAAAADNADQDDKELELPQLASFQLNVMGSSYTTPESRLEAWDELVQLRNEWWHQQALATTSGGTTSWMLRNVARTWELCASGMTKLCCNTNTLLTAGNTTTADADATARNTKTSAPLLNQWAMASAPARIDLSGGWSDTPPICFEYGGSVTGVAVTVDGYKPLSCRCRISTTTDQNEATTTSTRTRKGIWLRAESRNLENGELISSAEVSLHRVADLHDFQNPAATCALIKCALVYYGLVPLEHIFNKDMQQVDLQPYLNRFCLGGKEDNEDQEDVAVLEIVCTSLLPHGSGLGTSSILGGCIISAIGRCRGMSLSEQDLLQAVLSVEQLLTSGGGYQDQVNGLIGGVKMVSSARGTWPVSLTIDRVDLSPTVIAELNERLVLAFTGQTRLAKNILQNGLRRWARRAPEIVNTVKALVDGAHRAHQSLQDGNVTELGSCLNEYWTLKKQMAGQESGVEPSHVGHFLHVLDDEIDGASLCGAGGGGFLVVLAKPGGNLCTLRTAAEQAMPHRQLLPGDDDDSIPQLTWHACQVSMHGLTTGVLQPTSGGDEADWNYFDLSWQSPEFGIL